MPSKRYDDSNGLTADQQHYSTVLSELWNSYLRFLHVGLAAAGFTVLAIGQYVGNAQGQLVVDTLAIKISIVAAGSAGLCFALCRWLSQVIMERQVYGPRRIASDYFSSTETSAPNALRYPAVVIRRFYFVNEVSKFIGAISLLISWGSLVLVLFQQADKLGG